VSAWPSRAAALDSDRPSPVLVNRGPVEREPALAPDGGGRVSADHHRAAAPRAVHVPKCDLGHEISEPGCGQGPRAIQGHSRWVLNPFICRATADEILTRIFIAESWSPAVSMMTLSSGAGVFAGAGSGSSHCWAARKVCS
jgi:hypothetical protein